LISVLQAPERLENFTRPVKMEPEVQIEGTSDEEDLEEIEHESELMVEIKFEPAEIKESLDIFQGK
jgi:hypothetical protein